MKHTKKEAVEDTAPSIGSDWDRIIAALGLGRGEETAKRGLIASALRYHALGWSIIPVSGKRPVGKWSARTKTRQAARDLIHGLLADEVTGIAVVCGELSGVLVLDFDGMVGQQAFEELRPHFPPGTLTANTGGGGYHAYFAYEQGQRVQPFTWEGHRAGEIRGEGGIVVLPPSGHPSGGHYRWMSNPMKIGSLPSMPRVLVNALATPTAFAPDAIAESPTAVVERLLASAVRRVQEDGAGRNDTGFWLACQLRDAGVPKEAALRCMHDFQRVVADLGDHVYAAAEAVASHEQAYSRAPRGGAASGDPWPIERLGGGKLPDFPHDLLPLTVLPFAEDLHRRMGVPFSFVAVGILVTAAAVLGRRLVMRPIRDDNGWEEALNLWALIVAHPGELKSPVLRELTVPLFDIEKRLADQNRAARLAFEAELAAAKEADAPNEKPVPPPEQRPVVQDVTVEKLAAIMADNPYGVVSIQDEMSALLNGWARTNHPAEEPFYLKAAAGTGSHVVDRIKRGTQVVDNACLSLLGATQPEVLDRFLSFQRSRGTGANGLIQRFLIVAPTPEPWRDYRGQNNAELRRQYQEAILYLWDTPADELAGKRTRRIKTPSGEHHLPAELGGTPRLYFTPAAERAFSEWRSELENRARDLERPAAMRGFLGKERGYVPRIAAIVHLLGQNTGDVSEHALEVAVRWVELLELHAEAVYGAESSIGTGARVVAERIRDGSLQERFPAGTFSRRELSRLGWQGIATREALDNAIEDLLEANWLIEVTSKRKGSRIFRVHPKLSEGATSGEDGSRPSGRAQT